VCEGGGVGWVRGWVGGCMGRWVGWVWRRGGLQGVCEGGAVEVWVLMGVWWW
jgi:hypothetical protein